MVSRGGVLTWLNWGGECEGLCRLRMTKGPMQRPHPGLKCSDRIANSFVGLAVVTVINVGRTFSTD